MNISSSMQGRSVRSLRAGITTRWLALGMIAGLLGAVLAGALAAGSASAAHTQKRTTIPGVVVVFPTTNTTTASSPSAPAGGGASSTKTPSDNAGSESGTSAGSDSGTSAGSDSSASGGSESGTSAGSDSSANGGSDSGTSAGSDSGANGGSDSSANAGADSGANTGSDSSAAITNSLSAAAPTTFDVGNQQVTVTFPPGSVSKEFQIAFSTQTLRSSKAPKLQFQSVDVYIGQGVAQTSDVRSHGRTVKQTVFTPNAAMTASAGTMTVALGSVAPGAYTCKVQINYQRTVTFKGLRMTVPLTSTITESLTVTA